MRLSQLVSLFKRTNVFYPIVAVAIVVPNVALGAYGYYAIRNAQQQADEQVQGAYLSIVRHVRDQVQTELDALPQRIPHLDAATLGDFDVDGLDEQAAVEAMRKHAATWALEQAEASELLEGFFVVEQRELVMPPRIVEALERSGEANSELDAEQADPAPAPQRTDEAQMLARWHRFREVLWPRLRTYIAAGRVGLRATSHRDEQTGRRQFDLVTVFSAFEHGGREWIGIAWYDEAQLEQEIIAPLLQSMELPAGELVLIRDTDRQPSSRSLLVSERGGPAHWWIAVQMKDNIGAFRHGGQVGATVNLALLAIFMPFVAVGAVLMIRALVKDIREARQKTDFVSRVTHELKTPLTSIRLFIETLQMGGAQSEQEINRCLDIIQQESERLSKLIERVLDFSKMEMGNKVYHFREDDIETVVRDTIDFFRKQAVQKGAVIRLYIERNLPRFEFDRDGVREVLLNLLENAIKYSVGEKLAAIRLTRTRWHNQEAVQIQVIDNGVGIRREDMPRIFDQFYRVDDTLTKGIDGSGLGLTLSREIARAHAGDIVVESQQGRGSKFTLVLPLRGKK